VSVRAIVTWNVPDSEIVGLIVISDVVALYQERAGDKEIDTEWPY
jgi:hypothetical protein